MNVLCMYFCIAIPLRILYVNLFKTLYDIATLVNPGCYTILFVNHPFLIINNLITMRSVLMIFGDRKGLWQNMYCYNHNYFVIPWWYFNVIDWKVIPASLSSHLKAIWFIFIFTPFTFKLIWRSSKVDQLRVVMDLAH